MQPEGLRERGSWDTTHPSVASPFPELQLGGVMRSQPGALLSKLTLQARPGLPRKLHGTPKIPRHSSPSAPGLQVSPKCGLSILTLGSGPAPVRHSELLALPPLASLTQPLVPAVSSTQKTFLSPGQHLLFFQSSAHSHFLLEAPLMHSPSCM